MTAQFSELGADKVRPEDFPRIKDFINNGALDGTYQVVDQIGWQAQSANAQAAYGRVTLQFSGELTISGNQYNLSGYISAAPDLYDFDPQPWGVRNVGAELSTMGGSLLPGKPFYNTFSGGKGVNSNGKLQLGN